MLNYVFNIIFWYVKVKFQSKLQQEKPETDNFIKQKFIFQKSPNKDILSANQITKSGFGKEKAVTYTTFLALWVYFNPHNR